MKSDSEVEPCAISIDDAARLANMCRTVCYQEIRSGRLVARKIGRRTVILRADFDRWLGALPTWPAIGDAAP
jgi:excisionase family DNA binding protein